MTFARANSAFLLIALGVFCVGTRAIKMGNATTANVTNETDHVGRQNGTFTFVGYGGCADVNGSSGGKQDQPRCGTLDCCKNKCKSAVGWNRGCTAIEWDQERKYCKTYQKWGITKGVSSTPLMGVYPNHHTPRDGHVCYTYDGTGSCFPGESRVQVHNQGPSEMHRLKVGDKVLVDEGGMLTYQPILGFLHVIHGTSNFVTVTHSLTNETFRASATHLIFTVNADGSQKIAVPAGTLKTGDWVLANTGDGLKPSKILAVGRGEGAKGMFAPLTPAGALIVDGVSASNYAVLPSMPWLSHSMAHATLFPVRAFHQLGFAELLQPVWSRLCSASYYNGRQRPWYCQGQGSSPDNGVVIEETHPFVELVWKRMPFWKLFPAGSSALRKPDPSLA